MAWTYVGYVDLQSVRSNDIHLRAISQEISQPSVNNLVWKISYLKVD